MDQPSLKARAKALFQKHRRRLATLVLALFVAVVAVQVGSAIPRETQVDVPLGTAHADVTEARIEYWQEDELVRSITRRFSHGAPVSVRDTLDLSPGSYDVSVTLMERGGTERALTGRLTAPSDGVVRLALEGS